MAKSKYICADDARELVRKHNSSYFSKNKKQINALIQYIDGCIKKSADNGERVCIIEKCIPYNYTISYKLEEVENPEVYIKTRDYKNYIEADLLERGFVLQRNDVALRIYW